MTFLGIPQFSLKALVKHLYRRWDNHAVLDKAAQLSYYFIFALFPLLFALVALAAYLPIGGAVQNVVERASYVMPESAVEVIQNQLDSLLRKTRPQLLTLGFAAALWSASRGVDAIRTALNLAYDVKESRPYWKTQCLALLMTVAGTLLVLLSVTIIVLGGKGGYWVASQVNLGSAFLHFWAGTRWPISALFIMGAMALTYYLLPDVKQEFKFITPGSVTGTVMWLITTWGFTQYVGHFGNYNKTYGAIGGLIVLMTWFYISGLIFIMGGEINAALEHASAEGKVGGARAVGERPPPPDERPSAMPPGAVKSAGAAERSDHKGTHA